MDFNTERHICPAGTPEEKKKQLFEKQKELLDTFLAHHAITKAQYERSLRDMTAKMGMGGGCQ